MGMLAEHNDPATVLALCGIAGSIVTLLALLPRDTRTLSQLKDREAALPEGGVTPGF